MVTIHNYFPISAFFTFSASLLCPNPYSSITQSFPSQRSLVLGQNWFSLGYNRSGVQSSITHQLRALAQSMGAVFSVAFFFFLRTQFCLFFTTFRHSDHWIHCLPWSRSLRALANCPLVAACQVKARNHFTKRRNFLSEYKNKFLKNQLARQSSDNLPNEGSNSMHVSQS